MASVPVFTDTVNQQFFIEALGGSRHPISYLDRFPDAVYSKSIDSVLMALLYAILGPAGVGLLRQEYLEERLQIEEAGLSAADLDSLYTTPFAFARLAEETYDLDASAALLTASERAMILDSDAQFRNRAITFLKGIRAGGTPLGMSLVAQSGLNHPVDVIENYKALYDQFSDRPLRLPYMGTTASLNEVIVIPRKLAPQTAVQTLTIWGEPTSGYFTLTYPSSANYQVIQVGTTNGSNIITVPNAALVPPGVYVGITNNTTTTLGASIPVTYAAADIAQSPTSIALVHPPGDGLAGQAYNMTTTGTYLAFIGNAQTTRIAYNATAADIQAALTALPVIGANNVIVSGGPLPDHPIVITFTRGLGDTEVSTLQTNVAADNIAGLGGVGAAAPLVPIMSDAGGSVTNVTTEVDVTTQGVSASGQTAFISPQDQHAMEVALDQIRPQTVFVTVASGLDPSQAIPPSRSFITAAYIEVAHYSTGNPKVPWPPVDVPVGRHNWMQANIENEAPKPLNSGSQHYQGFHAVNNIIAYTDGALTDPGYNSPVFALDVQYYDTMIGNFSDVQCTLFPFLSGYNGTGTQFSPQYAVAATNEPSVISHTPLGGVVNNSFPVMYFGLPNLKPFRTKILFWSSAERTTGTDYLEIDLGSPQAVNYVYMEITRKPCLLDVAFDVLDQTPQRQFMPVRMLPNTIVPSTTSVVYDAAATNPWTTVEMHFSNNLGKMIYTRYLRIGFTREANNSPFATTTAMHPYSFEVRNLRIARNADVGTRSTRQRRVPATTYPSGGLYPSSSLFPGE